MPLIAVNPLIGLPPQSVYLSASGRANYASPFLVGEPIAVDSVSGTTLYGANTAGTLSTTKHQSFTQTLTGNKVFELASTITTPQNTSGGALSDANQLRVVTVVEGAFLKRTRGDQVAAAGESVVGAGGGTAVGNATLSIKGTTAANLLVGSVLMSLASSGVDVTTILVGDRITIAGDTTVYTATATTFTMNGTTEVNVSITPPLQVVKVAAQVATITAATARAVLVGTAPAVGAKVEIDVLDAADVVTVGNTAGALTAGRVYDAVTPNFVWSAGNVNLTKVMSH